MYGIYTFARNDFERLVVCSLIIIYTAISEFGRAWGVAQVLNMAYIKQEIDKVVNILAKDKRLTVDRHREISFKIAPHG